MAFVIDRVDLLAYVATDPRMLDAAAGTLSIPLASAAACRNALADATIAPRELPNEPSDPPREQPAAEGQPAPTRQVFEGGRKSIVPPGLGALPQIVPARKKARPNRRKLFPTCASSHRRSPYGCSRQRPRIRDATPSPTLVHRGPSGALIMRISCFREFSREYRGRMRRAELRLERRLAPKKSNSLLLSEQA